MAKDIARKLQIEKSAINSVLYADRTTFSVDNYVWRLIKTEPAIINRHKSVVIKRGKSSMIYDSFDLLGKSNIKATRTDFTNTTGDDGMKDIIRKVLLGGNVRDTTEFITQRRLLSSYASIIDLFSKSIAEKTADAHEYAEYVAVDLSNARTDEQRILDLWLLGLTKKGLDNIVRDEANLVTYKSAFADSVSETAADMREHFGEVCGNIELDGKKIEIDWNTILLLCATLGAQTLSIRGSAKSMNGKLFEKLMLGSLLSIMGFEYCPNPPTRLRKEQKLFWLSNMDENERETDATLVYNCNAVSIDIGFIGKGNPEITLDKVTRFNRYKQIAGMGHEMSTIIIVDTVGENSDLFNKAERVDGIVLQMSHSDWVAKFAQALKKIFNIDHPLQNMNRTELDSYLKAVLEPIDITQFI